MFKLIIYGRKVLIKFVGCAQKVGNRYEVEIRITYRTSSYARAKIMLR